MKNALITVRVSDKKLLALRKYQPELNVEEMLAAHLESLYETAVPQELRDFIATIDTPSPVAGQKSHRRDSGRRMKAADAGDAEKA